MLCVTPRLRREDARTRRREQFYRLHSREYGYPLTAVSCQHISMPPPYENLKSWQKSHELVLAIYTETTRWPADEKYGLISQIRRAAVSVGTNLAEGSARLGGRELRRFADIGLGSLAEVSYLLRTARDLGYLEPADWVRLNEMRDSTARLVYGLARSLGKPRPDP